MLRPSEILDARILIIDDQLVNVQLLELLLSDAGYTHVNSAVNSEQAHALRRKNDYDLILLDQHAPNLNSLAMQEGLRPNESTAPIPVIVLTSQPCHRLRASQSGTRDIVSAPFDLVEIKRRIHTMLEVHLLNKKLDAFDQLLEAAVQQRTAELSENAARYKSLLELATDWFWEQDEHGTLTKVSGAMRDILGQPAADGNDRPRDTLHTKIATREPFLNYLYRYLDPYGRRKQCLVSGEPIFGPYCRFVGYRGVGQETTPHA